MPTPSLMARIFSTLVFATALVGLASIATPAAAQTSDRVVVLSHGGVTNARILDLDTTGAQAVVRDFGQRKLVETELGPLVVRDLKILPDDTNLLADVDGRGVAITDADGRLLYSFMPPGERPRITSASVTAYAAPGEPTRLLVTDSNRSAAFVISPEQDSMTWYKSFSLPGVRATFANAIALPDSRAAVGVRWPSLGVSAIDLFRMRSGEPTDLIRRLASAWHSEAPADTVIVPELGEIRDVMGLADGDLLVTTRYGLLQISQQGIVRWSVDISQSEELRGEFASSRLLESGRIAVATFEPGVWANSHTHHRIHWLAAEALASSEIDVVASSGALEAAPARVEAARGHGGSGTFGFRPGLDTSAPGQLSDLVLVRELLLNQETYSRGEQIRGSARIQNAGGDPVGVSRASIVIHAGACDDQAAPLTVGELIALELAPGEAVELQGRLTVDQSLMEGPWCASVRARNAAGESTTIGEFVVFEVVDAPADTGSSVVVRDLGHWAADAADAGIDGDGAPDEEQPEAGCACTSTGRSVGASWLVLVVAGLLGWLRRLRMLG